MTRSEKNLLAQYQALPDEAKKSLSDYCEFLATKYSDTVPEVATPKDIPRPANESVVLAMRRLSETYYMINKDNLLHEASSLMSQHILQGREAEEVIDELEVMFKKFYDEMNGNKTSLLDKE